MKTIIQTIYRYIKAKLPDHLAIYLDCFVSFRRLPNIEAPKTFNEKIAWRKLNQRNPLFTTYADKIAAKAQVAKLIGERHIIETLWTGNAPEDIPLDDIVPPYVIKVNHSSGGNIFIRSQKDIDRKYIVTSINRQLEYSHGHEFREWAYVNIPRRVLVERMLALPGDNVPEDYKFFVYDGKVKFIQVDMDRFKAHVRNLYDRSWNEIEGKYIYKNTGKEFERPNNLDEMICIAEEIGAGFDFVRVDLYSVNEEIFFGEMTFYPEAGLGKFIPRDLDYKFGEPWCLHK